jgi:transcriptional regulator with XRE-family HTH domain
MEDVDSALAARLREERESRGWSLADLAARSGVSRAMVSKIERGEASPTAALLGRLSGAYGLTLSQLFTRVEDPRHGQVARADQQPSWRDPETGFIRRSLSPPGPEPLELVWGELPPGAEIAYPPSAYRFIADQQLVVVSGVLTLLQREEGREARFELNPGDCFRFGPARETVFRNTDPARCRYVVAVLRVPEAAGGRSAR